MLGFAFAASWTVVTVMIVHLPRLVEAAGASTMQAVAAGALIGPSQVGARLLAAGLMKRFHPIVSARLSVALHPLGAAVLCVFGAVTTSGAFTVLHGVAAAFSPLRAGRYGYRLGLLGAPSRLMMSAAPLVFGILIDVYGAGARFF